MTDQQINAAIDSIKGYDNYECRCDSCHPDWCNDLNAMHEAEKVLVEKGVNMWWRYVDFINRHNPTRLGRETAVHATARQRAEAFLLALGKWSATTEESSAVQDLGWPPPGTRISKMNADGKWEEVQGWAL